MLDPTQSAFYGLPESELRAALNQLQTALYNTPAGMTPISVNYTQGNGSRGVTNVAADPVAIRATIMEIKALLGISPGRRPIRFRF